MKSLVLGLLLVATTAHAAPRPTFHEAEGDLTMTLARQAPLPLQPYALMVLDTVIPLTLGVMGAGAGCLTGGAFFVLSGRTPLAFSLWPVRDTFLTYTAVGAFTGGTLSLVLADLVFNARHLGRILPSRIAWMAFMLPAPFLLSVEALTHGFNGLPSWLSVGAVLATRGTWLCSWACFPPLALVASAWTRTKTDDRLGSALWEEDRD